MRVVRKGSGFRVERVVWLLRWVLWLGVGFQGTVVHFSFGMAAERVLRRAWGSRQVHMK